MKPGERTGILLMEYSYGDLILTARTGRVEYLCTMVRHTQAVNVVRWAPRGRVLPDGSRTLLTSCRRRIGICWRRWKRDHPGFWTRRRRSQHLERDGIEDKEAWRTKHMCRSSGAEIYDLAWSPEWHLFHHREYGQRCQNL